MIALTIALAILVGVSLGLLGGGGSILTVPLLLYVGGQGPQEAIATSLLVVGVTSGAGAVSHARAGRVRWRTGLLFGGAGMAGAYAGGRIGAQIDGTVLIVAFGLMMAVTAVAMLRGRSRTQPGGHDHPMWRVLTDGVVVGLVTGLVGAGGGFLVVPALVLLGGLTMPVAVGTSLLVIALKSGAGFVGYLSATSLDWPVALGVTAAAVLGSMIGGRLIDHIEPERLRKGFAWFVATMAVAVLAGELPAGTRDAILGAPITWIAVALLLLGGGGAVWVRRRTTSRPREREPTNA